MDDLNTGTQIPGVTRNGNSYSQTPGDPGPAAPTGAPRDASGNSLVQTNAAKAALSTLTPSGSPPAAPPPTSTTVVPPPSAMALPPVTSSPTKPPMTTGTPMADVMTPLPVLTYKPTGVRFASLADGINAQRRTAAAVASDAPTFDLSTDQTMPFANRRQSLMQTMATPAFADGGTVPNDADDYARQAAAMEAEQLAQSRAKMGMPKASAPPAATTATSPVQDKPKSLLGGVMNLITGRRAQIDAAANYKCGGVVKGRYANGGEVIPDPTLETPLQKANAAAVTAAPPAEIPAATVAPSAPSTASAPSAATPASPAPAAASTASPGANIGGVPNGSTRWSTKSGAYGPGVTTEEQAAMETAKEARSAFDNEVRARAGQARTANPTPTPEPTPAAPSASAGTTGATAAEPTAAAAGEEVAAGAKAAEAGAKSGMFSKGVDAVKSAAAKTTGAATNSVKSMASLEGLAKAGKAGLALAPVIGGYQALRATPEELQQMGNNLGVDTNTNGGALVARTADFLNKTGNAATFGLATPIGEAIVDSYENPEYAKYRSDPVLGGVTAIGASLAGKLRNWWNAPKAAPATAPAAPAAPADGSLEKSVLAASNGTTGATQPADARFTPDATPAPLPAGAIRVGQPTGSIPGTATVSADQMAAPAGGGYITDANGRALYAPGQAPAAASGDVQRDAYGNDMTRTNAMRQQLRDLLRDRYQSDLESGLPYYQERGMRGMAALNGNPQTATSEKLAADMALESQRSKNRIAETDAGSGIEGIAAAELRRQLAATTDNDKRQALVDAATSTKGRYTLVTGEETETPMGNKLKGKQMIFDNKTGKYIDLDNQAATPSPADIKVLRDHADNAAFLRVFDERYGKGAAAKILGATATKKFAHGGCIGGIGRRFACGGKVKFAGGGEVIRGAGDGTSDSIDAHVAETGQPIKVSNGEYELSPEAAQRFGVDRLNDLLSKYHEGGSRPVDQGTFIVPKDVVSRLGVAYFDQIARGKNPPLPR